MAVDIRAAQAIRLLRDFSLGLVRDDEPDLSIRQIAILLIIYLEPPPHTVRGLAATLGVTKPVITRALDSMGKLDLVTRRRDEADRRNVIIHPRKYLAGLVQSFGGIGAHVFEQTTVDEVQDNPLAIKASPHVSWKRTVRGALYVEMLGDLLSRKAKELTR